MAPRQLDPDCLSSGSAWLRVGWEVVDNILLPEMWSLIRAAAAAIPGRSGPRMEGQYDHTRDPAGRITVVTSDPGDMRLVAGDRNIAVVAI